MKLIKLLSVIAIMLLSFNYCISQNLSLKQLIVLKKNKIDYINNYLLNKGWQYYSSEKNGNYDLVTWNYARNKYEPEKAVAWIVIFLFKNGENMITYESLSGATYNLIKDEIDSYKMKSFYSEINNIGIRNDYQGANYAVSIQFDNRDNINGYTFTLFSKQDYLRFLIFNKTKEKEETINFSSNTDNNKKNNENYDKDIATDTSFYINEESEEDASEGVNTLLEYIEEKPKSESYDQPPNNYISYTFTKSNSIEAPLREAPDINSNALYYCPRSSKVYVLENSDTIYWKVSVNGHIGYMSKSLIQ
jgi:hypothetical protein